MANEIKYNFGEKAVIYGVSAFVGIIVGFVGILLFAALMLAGDLREHYSSVISGIAVGIGSLASGFISSRKIKSGGIINGIICGCIIYVIKLFMSLFLSAGGFSLITLYHLLITLFSAIIGGILGVTSAAKRKIY